MNGKEKEKVNLTLLYGKINTKHELSGQLAYLQNKSVLMVA